MIAKESITEQESPTACGVHDLMAEKGNGGYEAAEPSGKGLRAQRHCSRCSLHTRISVAKIADPNNSSFPKLQHKLQSV